ncbi:DNA-binding response regulator [Floridanema evergladense]|uniref:DNA-binding response regulator n=1 Tax=Floridaenema evergladense BLCC-F167 TaxID=3153639 RepID=A0ABV4WWE9_9CYAN
MQQSFFGGGGVIRVLVVANSVVMRAGLEALITANSNLVVVGSVSSSDSWVQQVMQLQPDVLLWEWEESENDGVPTLFSLEPELANLAIVLLVNNWQIISLVEILRFGIRGVLPMEATAEEIIQAITATVTGLTVLHPDIVDNLVSVLPTNTRSTPTKLNHALTSREIEVLTMLAEGLGNKTIARRLGISEHTVKFHITSIFSKLNASSRTEAVILGARQGLILL